MSDAAAAGTGGAAAPAQTGSTQATTAAAQAAAAPDFKATKHRVPVDGREVEVDYDELRRGYSHAQAAAGRMKQAAETMKQAQAQTAVLKAVETGDWRPLIAKVGVEKAKSFAENFLLEYLDYQDMSPEKKEALREKQRADAAEKQINDAKAADEARQKEAAEQKAGKEIDDEIGAALKAHGKKLTPRLVRHIAEYQLAQLEAEQPSRLAASEALSRAVGDIHSDIAEYLMDMPPEEAVKHLPRKLLDGLRKYFAGQVMAQDPFGSGQQTGASDTASPKGKRKGLSRDDWFTQQEKKFGGR